LRTERWSFAGWRRRIDTRATLDCLTEPDCLAEGDWLTERYRQAIG
jgi:hypothetical protein